jgi:hypothetical protein
VTITAIYRTFDGDNTKPRPPYYSKLLAFQSFLLAWRKLPDRRLIVAVNSPTVPPSLAPLIEAHADEVRFVSPPGNARCYRAVLSWSAELDDDAVVYHAEDDYLYHPDAFVELAAAVERLTDVDYFTLYDHRDRYSRSDDVHVGRREYVSVAGTRHWRVVESTCMTYAARVRALKRDARLHHLMSPRTLPHDRLLWRMTQGIGWFWWKFPKRTLMSPMPSLATHLDPPYLAPVVDWTAIAGQVQSQASLLSDQRSTARIDR